MKFTVAIIALWSGRKNLSDRTGVRQGSSYEHQESFGHWP
jgi:hypothetical protein